jgi:hypothetical protein
MKSNQLTVVWLMMSLAFAAFTFGMADTPNLTYYTPIACPTGVFP